MRIASRADRRPNHVDEGGSIGSPAKLLSTAITPRSISPAHLPGQAGRPPRPTGRASRGCRRSRHAPGGTPGRGPPAARRIPGPQVSEIPGGYSPLASSASPTCRRKIDPRWFPPPANRPPVPPRCCDKRPHSVLDDSRSPCVPTRTTRGLERFSRCSPCSKKKYTPRRGHPIRPWHSPNVRGPSHRSATSSSSA